MSFRDDWLRYWHAAAVPVRPRLGRMPESAREHFHTIDEIATGLTKAMVIRLRGDQAQVFLDTPRVEGQDYLTWLRLPYPVVYIALESPLQFRSYLTADDPDPAAEGLVAARRRAAQAIAANEARLATVPADMAGARAFRQQAETIADPLLRAEALAATDRFLAEGRNVLAGRHTVRTMAMLTGAEEGGGLYDRGSAPIVKGVLLFEDAFAKPVMMTEAVYRPGGGVAEETTVEAVRRLGACFFIPHPEDPLAIHTANLMIDVDGQLHTSRLGLWRTRQRIIDWSIHLINFLSSPSVKLVRAEPDAKLQRARQRSGKAPLPGWYEITYSKHVQDYSGRKIVEGKAWEHSYRYDVRGHFKRFERGRMAGRVLWCPPHQRGLRHSLYKPKGYVTAP